MLYVSWNVNGIRAAMKKGFGDFFQEIDADLFAIQETKAQKHQIDVVFDGYHAYYNDALRKGYSGVAVYTKQKPINVTYGMGIAEHDQEGRLLTLEFPSYYFVACYTPNSQNELKRLDYRMQWEDDFLAYIDHLNAAKPVILTGDLNVAHEEIDIKNPKTNRRNAGFTDEERGKMSVLLSHGYVDTYRDMHPDKTDAYTWWSYRFKARERNAGWRIDYFIISERLKPYMKNTYIYKDVQGSDHCPIGLEMDL